jgi:hypothetical protein
MGVFGGRQIMHHNTGNEIGAQAAFVTFLSHTINEGFQKSGLGMKMGDFATREKLH